MKLGEKVRVTYIPSWTASNKDMHKVTAEGEVVHSNKQFYTVQFENYKEGFFHGDEKIKVEVLKNEHKRVG